MWENRCNKWGFLYYSSAKISCTRYNQENRRGFFVRNFTETSQQVSDLGEDLVPPLCLIASTPAWELRSPSVTLSLRCPSSALSSLYSTFSFALDLQTDSDTLSLPFSLATLPLIRFSLCRISTNEKIDLTRVTKYFPLVYFPNALDALLIIFQLRTNDPYYILVNGSDHLDSIFIFF